VVDQRIPQSAVALLINVSFITGCFPVKYKHAVVSPLLKKSDADKNKLKNYRLVSNLPLLSKLGRPTATECSNTAVVQWQRYTTAADQQHQLSHSTVAEPAGHHQHCGRHTTSVDKLDTAGSS